MAAIGEDSACSGMSMFNKMVSGCSDGAIFSPGRSDLSLEYLRLIFGSVSTALHGASNQLVGEMFRIFNLGILIVTGSLISYTVFSSVMGAAQDGSGMGGKVSPWVLIRIVSGTSLLIPTFNGYSGIQVMVMYAVVQGVGFANSAWSTALSYMESTGQSLEVTQISGTYSNAKATLPLIEQMTQSAVCLEAFKHACVTSVNPPSGCPLAGESIYKQQQAFILVPDYSNHLLSFGNATVAETCGSYDLKKSLTKADSKAIGFAGIASAANVLVSEAQSMVRQAATRYQLHGNKADIDKSLQCISSPAGKTCPFSMSMVSAANSLTGTMNLIRMEEKQASNPSSKYSWIPHAKSRGWITAGMHYRDLLSQGHTCKVFETWDSASNKCIADSGSSFTNYATQHTPPVPSLPGNDRDVDINPYPYIYDQFVGTYLDKNKKNAMTILTALTGASDVYSAHSNDLKQYYATASLVSQQLSMMTNQANFKDSLFSGVASGFAQMSTSAMLQPLYNLMALITGMTEQIMGIRFVNSTNQKYGVDPSNLKAAMRTSTSATSFSLSGAAAGGTEAAEDYNNQAVVDASAIAGAYKVTTDTAGGCAAAAACAVESSYCKYLAPTLDGCLLNYGLLGGIFIDKQGGNYDPIIGVSTAGQFLMAYAVGYWYQTTKELYDNIIGATEVLFGTSIPVQIGFSGAAAALYGEAPFASGALSAAGELILSLMRMFYEIAKIGMEMYVPLGAALAGVVFSLGVVMGVYIPFLPFLLYLFGVIGWVMAVIEAMVAAPLVALGVTHPEGHDLLGKAEQSLMLLLGVFVRPITMILGLFFSIQLASIAVKLFNHGFLYVATSFMSGFMETQVGGYGIVIRSVGFIGLVMVYAYVLMTILEQAYSLIYQIPDKILRWIGGPQESAGSVKQMVDQIKGQISSMGDSAGRAGSGVTKAPQVQGTTASGIGKGDDKKPSGGASGGGE